MIVIPLQSGSNGNCYYVETGDTACLIDAGISFRKAQQRLAEHDRDIRQVSALLISHDHGDHSRSMGVFQRKLDIPIYLTRPTLLAIEMYQKVGRLSRIRNFVAGATVSLTLSTTVDTIRTPHDGVDGVVFVVDDGNHRVGILTDLGHPFGELRTLLPTLDGVIIESNYDLDMLAEGPYPERLKRRIAGPGGHLSNHEAAELLKECNSGRLQWACLCHLSEENNTPRLAQQTHRDLLGDDFPIHVAWRDRVGDLLKL